MPRPKRSKVTPSVPVQHVPRPAPITSPAHEEQIFSPPSSGRVASGSNDSDDLVISKTRNTGKSTPMAQLYTMSGALAPEDIGPTRLRPQAAQTWARRSRVEIKADHAKPGAEKKTRKISRATSIEETEEIPSSIPTRSAESRRPSSSRLGPSSVQQSIQAGSRMRVQETPRLHSSSMLGGATFKKRPRQPSLLRMAQSQKNTSDGLDDNDMYDFMPDDESTPIIKALSHTDVQSTSSSSHQAPGSRKRKMKSPEVQVPASQSIDINSSPSAVLSPSDRHEESSEDNQPQPILPPPRSPQTPPPEIYSDTLAPPQSSSSPLPGPKLQKSRKKPIKAPSKAKLRSTKPPHKKFSSAPSPLSSTSTRTSPVRPAALKPLTTATLQNLLPRRRVRRRAKGAYDLPSSSDVELDNIALGEDEDELSFNATNKMRRKRPSMVSQKGKPKAKETVTGGKGKRISTTYTRKNIVVSDDENESESENEVGNAGRYGSRARSTTPALNSKAKEEMRRLAEKFREVDEYTLDFEDMTVSSDKMKDAR
ncbi:hypothetical protein JMJ35_005798 [Cladonia borealis]|uniref:Uncharacterized protein n=1 Tax=Cladonia borealis TaxID=184061 RepID=A0AA39QXY0_9LECA|nr:hypothetical protein JMJ35_005798 [Cladonia borealis]